MKIHDISPEISPEIAVFPGDTPFKRDVLMDFAKGDHLTLSSLTATLHLGAHADAPSHYHPSGKVISERPLEAYIGPCEVKAVCDLKPGERVSIDHLKGWTPTTSRVLFRTDSFLDPNQWNDEFNSLSPELLNWLAAQNVKTVGIDTPSVDPSDSKELESHQALYKNDFSVLEGLVLKDIEDGVYFLVALPLKIAQADASPVRAILIADGAGPLGCA